MAQISIAFLLVKFQGNDEEPMTKKLAVMRHCVSKSDNCAICRGGGQGHWSGS